MKYMFTSAHRIPRVIKQTRSVSAIMSSSGSNATATFSADIKARKIQQDVMNLSRSVRYESVGIMLEQTNLNATAVSTMVNVSDMRSAKSVGGTAQEAPLSVTRTAMGA
eukprot:gb/GFBE01010308.1/.p2 GENE.gb/GFBE01010308.1/~~gb/GFBE01010308.1/.p2  ORF type:complete len:109 (-),score=14.48 gb/GFBE01010308.1/:57-383(-)